MYSPLTRAIARKTFFLIMLIVLMSSVILYAQKESTELISDQPQKMGVWLDPHGALGLVIPASQKPITESVPVVVPGTTCIFDEASGGDTKEGASGLWWWTTRNFQYNLAAGNVWAKAETACAAGIECGCYAEAFVWNTFEVGGTPGAVVNGEASVKVNIVGNLNKASAPPGSPVVVVYFLLYDMTDGTNIYKILHDNDLTGPFSTDDPGSFIEGNVDFKTVGGQISANLVGGHTYRLYVVLYTRSEQNPVAGFTNITEADYYDDNPIRPDTTGGVFRDTLSITLQPDLVPKLNEISGKADAIEAKSDRLETSVGTIDNKVDSIEAKADSLETAVGSIEAKADSIEAKADALEVKIDSIELKSEDIVVDISALEAKSDALEAKSDALEGKADAIEAKIDQSQSDDEDLLELHIEEHLYYQDCLASLFLPSSLGGRLELVKDIVEKWITNCESAGYDTSSAWSYFNTAVGYYNTSNYRYAYKYFSKAYKAVAYCYCCGCGSENEPEEEAEE